MAGCTENHRRRGGIGSGVRSVSEFLFGDCLDLGKTMDLAPYGKRCPTKLFLEIGESILNNSSVLCGHLRRSRENALLRGGTSVDFDYEMPLLSSFAASIQYERGSAAGICALLQRHTGSKRLAYREELR